MAAGQVALFRSESISPISSTVAGGGGTRYQANHANNNNSNSNNNKMSTKMTTASSSSTTQGASSSKNVNNGNGNNDPIASPSPRSNNSEGITILMAACQEGRPEAVQKILKKKSSTVKDKTRSGKIALHFCAESGNLACTDQILGADPSLKNAQDEEGYTPLHLAVINGNKDIVRKLIGVGADLNCLDNENHSLVHWATVCGEVDILELLLSNGAPASTPDIHLAHPIHYAGQMCGSINGVGSVSRTRVQSTVYGVSPKKGLSILKRLIQHGCPVDVRDQDGRQPLLWASSAGSGDAILLLVKAGAKVDAEDKDGLTALHCAASRGHTDCLETLIALCGAEVDVIDNNGCTALFYAVTLGHADCTELLLNYGSEPNRQDRKGRTSAHCGAAKGQLETLKLLSKHGGNLWLRNVRGDLPLHEAVLSRRKDLVMWLLGLRHEAVNTPNNDGRCPIHLAALNNNVEMVKILIDHRADVNLLMRSGKGTAMTPLDAAMHKGNSAVAKFLQIHGGLPSNSLNDAALHRRLNRSIEGQISPAGSSMRESHLGSHHHPSPDDHLQQRTLFTSPDVFDHSSSVPPYSRTDFSKGESHPPPIATSTPIPIMDGGVQTDAKYLRDTECQVSDSFDDHRRDRKSDDDDGSNGSHRKSERRRRRNKSSRTTHPQNNGSTSNNSSPDRSSTNQISSKSSRKSSRKKGNSGGSNNSRASEGGGRGRESSSPDKDPKKKEELPAKSKSKSKSPQPPPSPVLKKQDSSDALLDQEENTMASEKFSELENVGGGVQSSETDAREEELDNHDDEHQQQQQEQKEDDDDVEKRKSKSPSVPPVVPEKEGRSSRSKSKSKSRELSPPKNKSKSKTPERSSRDRSASAKSTREHVNDKGLTSDKRPRSRSASGDSRTSSIHDDIIRSKSPKTPTTTATGSGNAVTWDDDDKNTKKAPRNRSKSATERERRSRSKSIGGENAKGTSRTRDRSKSATERGKAAKPKDVKVVKIGKDGKMNTVQKNDGRSRSASAKKKKDDEADEAQNQTQDEDEDGQIIYDEIEAGKTINLQEAARRRSESLARDPSRSRSRSISVPRHNCNELSVNEESIIITSSQKRSSTRTSKNRKGKLPTTSEEREIALQEALLGSSSKLRPGQQQQQKGSSSSRPSKLPTRTTTTTSTNNDKGKVIGRQSVKKSRIIRKSSQEHYELQSNSTVIDSGFSDRVGSTSEEMKNRLSPPGKSYISVKRRVVTTRRPGSSSSKSNHHRGESHAQQQQRKSIFSSSPKQYRIPKVTKNDHYDTLIVHQMSIENGVLEDELYSTSTRGSVTSEETREPMSPRRKKTNYSRPRSRLTFSRNDNPRQSPRPKKGVEVETPISVTQAMQASMRKYNLERMIFHELLELKRLQMRAGKANEQLLVKRLAENYKRAGFSVNFRDFEGPPFTFRNFEKYLYDQLRLLQNNRKVLPHFAPSDDIEKLSTALKKMNSAKLPYLEDAERSESVCDNIQCSHTTHRCHHAAHAYTGVPCAAYIGNRKPTFLPRVNPLKAPGPTQKDKTGTKGGANAMNLNSPMQISITPRTDTQSPITLEVQQGLNTQVFTLPTKTLDPSKDYYVSLSIKPNPTTSKSSPVRQQRPPPPLSQLDNGHRPNPVGDVVDDGSISAPPPPGDGSEDVIRDKHNRSM